MKLAHRRCDLSHYSAATDTGADSGRGAGGLVHPPSRAVTALDATSVVESAASLHRAPRPATDKVELATASQNAVARALPSAVVELALAPAGHPVAARLLLIGVVARRCAIRATVIRRTIVGAAISAANRLSDAKVAAHAADRRRAATTGHHAAVAVTIRLAPAAARFSVAAVEFAAHGAITGFGTIGCSVLRRSIGRIARGRRIGRIRQLPAGAAGRGPARHVFAVDQAPASQSNQAEDGPHKERAPHWITAAPTCMSAVHFVRKSHPLLLSVNAVTNRGLSVLKSWGAIRWVIAS